MADKPPARRLSRPRSPRRPKQPPDDHAAALELLREGELEIEGRLIVASNATLYCTIRQGPTESACV